LKKDNNKDITQIDYNYLKLPKTITFDNGRTITTQYDAQGSKLKKIDSNGETTDYEEDEIYVNNVLYQTSHDEGRIVNGIYEYNITDHLGNLRVAFKDSSGIAVPLQSLFYDPWGLSMKGMAITRNPVNFNKFQFLNRETQFETGYIDLIHRQFDPTIARFISQDPVIEGQEHVSLYQYSWNNPILKSDPDGMWPGKGIWNGFKGWIKEVIGYNNISPELKRYSKEHPFNAAVARGAAHEAEHISDLLGDNSMMNGETTQKEVRHDGGIRNAIKHTFAMASMASKLGVQAATEMGNINEITQIESPLKQMDLANNAIGVQIGSKTAIIARNSTILSKVLDVGLEGKLSVVTFDSNKTEKVTKVDLSDKKYARQVSIIRTLINQMKDDENRPH
jgi:RHS repeat-associated protein